MCSKIDLFFGMYDMTLTLDIETWFKVTANPFNSLSKGREHMIRTSNFQIILLDLETWFKITANL